MKKNLIILVYRSKNMDVIVINSVLTSYEENIPRPVRKEIQMAINIYCKTQC